MQLKRQNMQISFVNHEQFSRSNGHYSIILLTINAMFNVRSDFFHSVLYLDDIFYHAKHMEYRFEFYVEMLREVLLYSHNHIRIHKRTHLPHYDERIAKI